MKTYVIDGKNIQDTMHDWYGMVLTEDQVRGILDSHPSFMAEVAECGFDTVAREKMADYVCEKIGINTHWPLYEDTVEYTDEFYEKFALASEKHNYEWLGKSI